MLASPMNMCNLWPGLWYIPVDSSTHVRASNKYKMISTISTEICCKTLLDFSGRRIGHNVPLQQSLWFFPQAHSITVPSAETVNKGANLSQLGVIVSGMLTAVHYELVCDHHYISHMMLNSCQMVVMVNDILDSVHISKSDLCCLKCLSYWIIFYSFFIIYCYPSFDT